MQPNKKTKRQTRGLYALFLLTVPIEEGSTLAIYKTVLIIFPLNLQTIARAYRVS